MLPHGSIKITSPLNRCQQPLWNLTSIMVATICGYGGYYNDYFSGVPKVLIFHCGQRLVIYDSCNLTAQECAVFQDIKETVWHFCSLLLGYAGF
jgi:hypothetical protein